MTSRSFALLRTTAVFAALGALLYFATRRLDMARLMDALTEVRGAWLIAAIVCYVIILPLWALQWRYLAPRVAGNTWAGMFRVAALASAALNSTPLLVGEVAGVMLLVTHIGISAAEAVSVSAMDQLLVGIAKVAVITSAALTNALPVWMTRGLIALATGVALFAVVALVASFNTTRWRLPAITQFIGGLASLRAPERSIPALALALAKKGLELLAIIAVQRAFGVQLPATSALLILASLNLATIMPIVPGNLGVYEGVVTVSYVILGLDAERAAAIAVVQHACFWAAVTLPGYMLAAFGGLSRRVAAAR